jgi:1-acyl-sn-glycerol-3-phosphate acyltransferase
MARGSQHQVTPLRLPAGPVRGTLTFLLICANTVACVTPLFAVALAKWLVPLGGWRRASSRWLTAIAEQWIANNTAILRGLNSIRLEVRGVESLRRREWYLVLANHRSWVDIVAVQAALNRRIPFLKFFLKRELVFVPVMGLAWWALDMPFMKRHSRAYLAKHPEKRSEDLETTRRACAKFREIPTSVINFVEGTRFTPAKHAAAKSPFRHLLPPRAGGTAFVLGAMGSLFHALLDVTIVYPDGSGGFWDLCCGRIAEIVVEVREHALEPWLAAGDYHADPVFRVRFQAWLGALWAEKDACIDALLAAHALRRPEAGAPASTR